MRPVFFEQDHSYRDPGRGAARMPSVTEIVDAVGLVRDSEYFTEESRDRGKAVHDYAALIFEHDGDDVTIQVESGHEGYLRALQAFVVDKRPKPILVECPLGDPDAWYAGTPDFVGGWADVEQAVLDVKSGAEMKWHRVQTEAYARLAALELGIPFFRRFTLYLKPTGTYRLIEHDDYVADAGAWGAALVLYHFMGGK